MITYPMIFSVSSKSNSGIQTQWQSKAASNSIDLPMCIPPEFEGPGHGFSPEDLYAMALQNCFIATFKVFAEKSKLTFTELEVNTTLTVDRDDKGRPWMSKVHLDIHLTGSTNKESIQRVLEKTSQSCMILNSVKTEKTFNFKIE